MQDAPDMPEYAPSLSDGMVERLGDFYVTHAQLHAVPFLQFAWNPLAWCRWAGVAESPYRWRALPEPKLPATRRRWWHFSARPTDIFILAACAAIAVLIVGGYLHGATTR